jgi:aldehyde:ferredoxin oxidoreductase
MSGYAGKILRLNLTKRTVSVIETKQYEQWGGVRNSSVEIKDARRLWGLDTWQAQQEIWNEVAGGAPFGDWMGNFHDRGRTTQRPAVLTIGPAGENRSRAGCLIHDAGNAAGLGGFGGIWGSKNLKAISVIGTGSVQIADPNALMETRLWAHNEYGYHVDHESGIRDPRLFMSWERPQQARFQACVGCSEGCRNRSRPAHGNESQCVEVAFYSGFDRKKHGKQTSAAYVATDLLQKYGVNAYEAWRGLEYLVGLYEIGVIGSEKEIENRVRSAIR